jgi:hypothetical protein
VSKRYEKARLLATNLRRMVEEHGHKWGSVAQALERPAAECRNRYIKCFAQKEARRKGMYVLLCSWKRLGMRVGSWSPGEESRLTQIMRDLDEEGKTTGTLNNFWEVVAGRMDNTRTAHQCRNKWYVRSKCRVALSITIYRNDSLYPKLQNGGKAPRWSHTDSYILIQKYVLSRLTSTRIHITSLGWRHWNSTQKGISTGVP